MAKRRMVTEEILYDEEFNSLSIEAQNLFTRMICISDDCGVVPASIYDLGSRLNLPEKVRKNSGKYLNELVLKRLGILFLYQEKQFFAFKPDSFDRINNYIIKNRTKSEYLKMSYENYKTFIKQYFVNSSNLQENIPDSEAIIYKDKSIKIRDKREEIKDKRGAIPTFEEVKEFVLQKGKTIELAKQIFEHYELGDWHDTNGKPVKNWKQKINTNWINKNGNINNKSSRKLLDTNKLIEEVVRA